MKKKYMLLCVAVALCTILACEKAISVDEDVVSIEGNLKVSVFKLEQTPFSSVTRTQTRAAVTEACTRLNFVIYSADGTRTKYVNQKSEDKSFGTAGFQLEEGNYLLVVVGHSSDGNPTTTDPTCIKFTNSQGFTDTFLYAENITIGEEEVEKQVTLKRIVALCRFVVNDSFPAEVKKMHFCYTGGSGAFDANDGLGSVNSKQEVKFDVDGTTKQFDLYTFLHDKEGTIRLAVTALDDNGNELYIRSFDVPMQRNYITWLEGDFFTGGGSSATTITGVSVDTDWAGEKHITF